MFNRKLMMEKQKPIIFNKNNSSYRKLEKEMSKPASDYEQIKKLIESSENNDLKYIDNKTSKNTLVKLLPHKKK